MSEQDTTTDATSRLIITPLIPTRPRLRFLEGEGDGAAGDGADEGAAGDGSDESGTASGEGDGAESGAGEDALGDAGKQALDRMKADRKKALDVAKAATARADAAEAALANKDKPADEVAIDAARAEGTKTATDAANLKLAKSALKLAAKGRLADPADAIAFIDASKFDVDEEGEPDPDAVNEAIEDLIARKPHLGIPKQTRFDGAADQGAKGKDATPPQWTEADLARATDDDTVAAKAEGKLNNLLGIKP